MLPLSAPGVAATGSLKLPVGIVRVVARANGRLAQNRQTVAHFRLIGISSTRFRSHRRGVGHALPMLAQNFLGRARTIILGRRQRARLRTRGRS